MTIAIKILWPATVGDMVHGPTNPRDVHAEG